MLQSPLMEVNKALLFVQTTRHSVGSALVATEEKFSFCFSIWQNKHYANITRLTLLETETMSFTFPHGFMSTKLYLKKRKLMIRLKLFLKLNLWNEVNVWIDFCCRSSKCKGLIFVSCFKTSIFFSACCYLWRSERLHESSNHQNSRKQFSYSFQTFLHGLNFRNAANCLNSLKLRWLLIL